MQIKPDLPETVWESSYFDDFDSEYLSTDWMFPRVPEPDGVLLQDSHVKIKGSCADLDSMGARNILLRRQQHFKFTSVCKMKMPQLYPGQDAGMTCYYDENTFVKFGVFATQEPQPRLIVKAVEVIGEQVKESGSIELDFRRQDVYLKIETNDLKRTCYMSYDGKEYIKVAVLENVYYLCDEGLKKGKRFTGAMIGMYAYAGDFGSRYVDEYGRHGDDTLYVDFDWFDYQPEK